MHIVESDIEFTISHWFAQAKTKKKQSKDTTYIYNTTPTNIPSITLYLYNAVRVTTATDVQMVCNDVYHTHTHVMGRLPRS